MSLLRNASAVIAAACLFIASCASQTREPASQPTSPASAAASQPTAATPPQSAVAMTQGGDVQPGARKFASPPPGHDDYDNGQDDDQTAAGAAKAPAWKPAVPAKPLSANINKGLDWLVAHQLPGGGWGQGDESPQMRGSAQNALRDKANVADTSMAVLALMRSGNMPGQGKYQKAVHRGIDYILSEIEESDADSLFVTDVRGTRVQGKIGTYVDTFSSLMVLTEVKGQMPGKAENQRLERALAKVLRKIEKNQRQDGTWDNQGWAPVLTQSMAAKGLNRAAQAGEDVDGEVLTRVESQARSQFDARTGSFGGGGSAGVGLYAGAANSAALRDSVTTRKTKEGSLRRKMREAKSEQERAQAQAAIADNRAAEKATESAEKALLDRLDDPSFIQGFGNNGGEEFLSYMLVSESLVAKGGTEWKQWEERITQLVNRVQNGDGSWTGHHCITGRTFCTAAALLVLMADRTPVPMAAQIRGA